MVNLELSDIIKGCVARVDASFFERDTDPFHVFFEAGDLAHMKKSVASAPDKFPLVWFIGSDQKDITGGLTYVDEPLNLLIVMPTNPHYSQAERKELTFKPRLIPIKEQVLREINRERRLVAQPGGYRARERELPYWGSGDVNGTSQTNLLKDQYIDALSIFIPKVKVKKQSSFSDTYHRLTANQYPVLT
jgi:hypothetical protein